MLRRHLEIQGLFTKTKLYSVQVTPRLIRAFPLSPYRGCTLDLNVSLVGCRRRGCRTDRQIQRAGAIGLQRTGASRVKRTSVIMLRVGENKWHHGRRGGALWPSRSSAGFRSNDNPPPGGASAGPCRMASERGRPRAPAGADAAAVTELSGRSLSPWTEGHGAR